MKWSTLEIGGGEVQALESEGVRLKLPECSHGYVDAQIDDYHHLPRRNFIWRMPVHLQVQARCSTASPIGTLGFGFWNDPFSLTLGQGGTARRLPAPPQALWFFYGSAPNDIQLAPPGLGPGWKAMVLRSPRLPSMLTLPLAVIGVGLAQLPLIRGWIMQAAQRVVQGQEALLGLEMDQWHTYEIYWGLEAARFHVDGVEVLSTRFSPRGPLGFVAWIDNQFLQASPSHGFNFGVLPIQQEQSLELKELRVGPAN